MFIMIVIGSGVLIMILFLFGLVLGGLFFGGKYIGLMFMQNGNLVGGLIMIDFFNNMLVGICDVINLVNLGVLVSIVNDGSGSLYCLVLMLIVGGFSLEMKILVLGDLML